MKYSRQEAMSFINDEFQDLIKKKNIVVVGCGGVGSILCELLVRGGFLNLKIIDNDFVDNSNLQRQNFRASDVKKPKVEALKEILEEIEPQVNINEVFAVLDEKNISELCKASDLIIDATDNFETRIIINEFCEKNNKDWIYNGAIRTEIVCCLFRGEDKLFSKVFPKIPKNEACHEVGVLGSTTFTSASISYNQVLKYFLGINERKLIKYDTWENKVYEVNI